MRWPRLRSRVKDAETQRVLAGTQPIARARVRTRSRVCGEVIALTYPPLGTPKPFAVRLSDGSGSILLSFLGRRSVPGFELGRWVIASGTVSEQEGLLTMFDPHYQLLPREDE